ncbi:MAG: membrane lipoprotein lipid attachment site-containing protein [Planctomycetes bacterium]|nr:membrane lipoprotein lipid attachment site-containing protein [Planctomycetota bacterium]
MKRAVILFAAVALLTLSGCTMFQDDIYKAQAGYYLSDSYAGVDNAIKEEFVARFGKERVKRADVEWKYDHWTAISNQQAIGSDKYRTRVSAYPQLGADGHYEAIVVARREVYTGYSSGRGGPTAMYSNMWTEAGRDVHVEAELSNAIIKRLETPSKAAKGGGK